MKICIECKRFYPVELISPLFLNGEYYDLCAECALKTVNDLHGLPEDTPFRGTQAKQLYEDTVKYNENRKNQ